MSQRACIRFEIEYDDGTVHTLTGEDADFHFRWADSACCLSSLRGGMPSREVAWTVRPAAESETSLLRAALEVERDARGAAREEIERLKGRLARVMRFAGRVYRWRNSLLGKKNLRGGVWSRRRSAKGESR
jgi:hypothetical protein